MKVKFKKLSDTAVIPSYAKPGDAGLDLTATYVTDKKGDEISFPISVEKNYDMSMMVYHTDLAIEIPKGFMGLIFPRSNITTKPLTLANCVGVIDAGYRGEIQVRMKFDAPGIAGLLTDGFNDSHTNVNIIKKHLYKPGDRVAQLIILPYPEVELEEVNELSSTERGEGAFGSTNKI